MINRLPTNESPTDAQVIEESLENPASFSSVFERHFTTVHRYLSQRLGAQLADELGAETFLVAFDRRSRYDLARPDARPWLLGIASNLVRRHWRDERRWLRTCERVAGEKGENERTSPADPPAASPSSALGEDLTFSLRKLKRHDREPLLLFAWAELSYEEIAAGLDIPIGTVRSRINRARTQMRESLGLRSTRAAGTELPQGVVASHEGDFDE